MWLMASVGSLPLRQAAGRCATWLDKIWRKILNMEN